MRRCWFLSMDVGRKRGKGRIEFCGLGRACTRVAGEVVLKEIRI